MGKHAYLIMAHNNFSQLKKLLLTLDDVDNDIYLHIDRKSKKVPWQELRDSVEESTLFFVKRIPVYWGHSSQVRCELNLLREALSTGRGYDFIHLISGADLPLKSQQYIHHFFDMHSGQQFLQIGGGDDPFYRIDSVHFRRIRHLSTPIGLFERVINRFCIGRGDRKLKAIGKANLIKTSNWFSITEDCAKYIVSCKSDILRFVRFSSCADEFFVGTFLYGTKFWDELYKKEPSSDGHMRFIDWTDIVSKPHVFLLSDKKRLDESDMLFARKFDERIDSQIIDYIVQKAIH